MQTTFGFNVVKISFHERMQIPGLNILVSAFINAIIYWVHYEYYIQSSGLFYYENQTVFLNKHIGCKKSLVKHLNNE